MFVKSFFEKSELLKAKKNATLTRPAIAGPLKTSIIKVVNGFTYTTPWHERSRSAGTY